MVLLLTLSLLHSLRCWGYPFFALLLLMHPFLFLHYVTLGITTTSTPAPSNDIEATTADTTTTTGEQWQ